MNDIFSINRSYIMLLSLCCFSKSRAHTFVTKCLRFSLPNLLNYIPSYITDRHFTHSMNGLECMSKILFRCQN